MKKRILDINSQNREINEYQYLLEHSIVPTLTDSTSSYIESRIMNSNPDTTLFSISGCILTPDTTSAYPTSGRLLSQTTQKIEENNIPVPVNGKEYTPYKCINLISNDKCIKTNLIKTITKQKVLSVKSATIHRIMRKYKEIDMYNKVWHTKKGRRPHIKSDVFEILVQDYFESNERASNDTYISNMLSKSAKQCRTEDNLSFTSIRIPSNLSVVRYLALADTNTKIRIVKGVQQK